MRGLRSGRRGVAPVISTILMVAVVVVLSATIATFVLEVGEDVSDPGPNIGETAGTLETNAGFDGGTVRITHVAGDTVAVGEMEIVVDASDACNQKVRIVNLPAEGPVNSPFESDRNFEGDEDLLSEGFALTTPGFGEDWDPGVLHVDTDNQFGAGDFFEFRIRGTTCSLSSGDEISVDLVHTPTNSIVVTQELRVTN